MKDILSIEYVNTYKTDPIREVPNDAASSVGVRSLPYSYTDVDVTTVIPYETSACRGKGERTRRYAAVNSGLRTLVLELVNSVQVVGNKFLRHNPDQVLRQGNTLASAVTTDG